VFEQIKDIEKASEVWQRLIEIYDGNQNVKSDKLYMLKGKLFNFKMEKDESIPKMFYRLQVIVNDLKNLGEKVKDEDFSHKFLMCLPKRFSTSRRTIFREGLSKVTPNEVLGDIMTDAQYNDDLSEGEEDKREKKDKKEKSMAKASSSSKGKSKKEESSEEEMDSDDEAMALLVRKMGKFTKKKGYGARKRRDFTKGNDNGRLCFKCKSPDHVVVNCPHLDDDDDDNNKKDKNERKEKKSKKMSFKKNKKGGGYIVTCDSDVDDDEDSDDEKELEAMKKAFGGVAIFNKPSLFDDATSTCLMAKATKITYNDDACDDDDSCSDDDEDPSKEELMDMCEQLNEGFQKKRKECKGLLKKVQDLEKSLREFQASHECLKEDHEELENAHTKLAKAHSILLDQAKVEDVKETRSIGLTCDIVDKSFYKPIVISQTNPSCSPSSSTTDSSSSMSDGFTCDASLMVENETLKRGG